VVTKRIVVVGGGPAGMMAAIRAAELKQEVILIEKNSGLGRKLLLTGKGRCNITNACDLNSFLERFSKNGQFLRDAFKSFFNEDLISFFRSRGLHLKTERQLRVFPATDRSNSIVDILNKELNKNKVTVICKSLLKDILIDNSVVKSVSLNNSRVIPADRVILCMGGLSYSFTGSDGYGLELAKSLGHSIVEPRPGLVPLRVKQAYPRLLEGLTLKNIRLVFSDGRREIISDIGELLFTDSGISGPLVLSLSGKIIDWLRDGRSVYVEIDLKPALSKEQLDKRILREFEDSPKKSVKNLLKNFLPNRLIKVLIDMAKISQDKKVCQITQAEREKIISLLKAMRLDIAGSLPIEKAMVTRGGVSLKDINPRTMESRIIKGLYFAGEMIDVDADTGGFNLQAAFSTGYLAGQNAALN